MKFNNRDNNPDNLKILLDLLLGSMLTCQVKWLKCYLRFDPQSPVPSRVFFDSSDRTQVEMLNLDLEKMIKVAQNFAEEGTRFILSLDSNLNYSVRHSKSQLSTRANLSDCHSENMVEDIGLT